MVRAAASALTRASAGLSVPPPPRAGAQGSPSPVPARNKLASFATAPPRLDAPRAEWGGTTSPNIRFAQLRADAHGQAARWYTQARSRLSRGSVPPGDVLPAAHALLGHPPLRAGASTPEGEWLDELASLVRRADPVLRAQNSYNSPRGPSRGATSDQPRRPAARTGGTTNLRSWLNKMRASEDARTSLKRAQERRRQAEEEHASSNLPVGGVAESGDNDIGPYRDGCRAFAMNLRPGQLAHQVSS
jgi:hypothetical protein